MEEIRMSDIAKDYRFMERPFSLAEMLGGPYLSTRGPHSVRDWLRFEWVQLKPNESMFRMVAHLPPEERIKDSALRGVWSQLQHLASEIDELKKTIDPKELETIRGEIPVALGLEASDLPYPTKELGLVPGFSIPPIEVDGIFKLPEVPKIPGLDSIIPPSLDVSELLETVTDDLVGVTEGVLQSIRDLILAIPEGLRYTVSKFADRIGTVGALLRRGELDQALGELFHATIYLATDAAHSGAALVVNWVYDTVAATVLGLCFGRPMTQGERNLAHSIFGNRINVTNVRVVTHLGWDRGIVAANVIYMPSIDLQDPETARDFAHELTHIYQDQNFVESSSTYTATREQLGHMFSTHGSAYKYSLDANTIWDHLGAEEQAQLVEDYYEIEISNVTTNSRNVLNDPVQMRIAKSILRAVHFFEWK